MYKIIIHSNDGDNKEITVVNPEEIPSKLVELKKIYPNQVGYSVWRQVLASLPEDWKLQSFDTSIPPSVAIRSRSVS